MRTVQCVDGVMLPKCRLDCGSNVDGTVRTLQCQLDVLVGREGAPCSKKKDSLRNIFYFLTHC